MFYWRFSIGSLRMSEKSDTLEGYESNKARSIDDGRLWKNIERKEENAVEQQFSNFFKMFSILSWQKTVCVLAWTLLQMLPI